MEEVSFLAIASQLGFLRLFHLEFTRLMATLSPMFRNTFLPALALSAILAPLPVGAQNSGLPDPGSISRVLNATDISPEVWQQMTAGRTVTYLRNGTLFGTEHYHPNSNRAAFRHADGTCLDGTWAFTQGLFCFYWEDLLPACFHHRQDGRGIIVIAAEADGDFNFGNVQDVSEITDVPIVCQPEGTS